MIIQLNREIKAKLLKAMQDGFIDTTNFRELFPDEEFSTIEKIRKAFGLDNMKNPIEHHK